MAPFDVCLLFVKNATESLARNSKRRNDASPPSHAPSPALWLVLCLATPMMLSSQTDPQAAARAGEVERVIPDVRIERQVGARSEPLVAESRTPVFWLDTLYTADRARARVRLDDGSALHVGSRSSSLPRRVCCHRDDSHCAGHTSATGGSATRSASAVSCARGCCHAPATVEPGPKPWHSLCLRCPSRGLGISDKVV